MHIQRIQDFEAPILLIPHERIFGKTIYPTFVIPSPKPEKAKSNSLFLRRKIELWTYYEKNKLYYIEKGMVWEC